MKLHAAALWNITLHNCNNTSKKVHLLVSISFLLTITPLICFFKTVPLPPKSGIANGSNSKCDVFSGEWVPYSGGPYYSNETCYLILDQQNCLKFGRPDREFLKWRWQPQECHLPFFDAALFWEIVRGKSIAFVGDSLARNQMQSLLCLLARVDYPVEISVDYSTDTDYFKRYIYKEYNLTIAMLWSPFLVKSSDADPGGHSLNSIMKLRLDEADEAWAGHVESFDYVIISAGQWFFRPLIYYESDKVVGCHICNMNNITSLTNYYGYRKAFRTAFKTLQGLDKYRGMTILRTYSPEHFENGQWDRGGDCRRTRPFTRKEKRLEGHALELYLTQVEELRAAERKGRGKGLRFGLLDTTEVMALRADGHPGRYGHSPEENVTVNDCVHWCLPGPVDTWNELLLYLLKGESERAVDKEEPRNAS